MEIYNTEEQQVEAIKRFWQQNGLSIIAGIVIGFAGLYGFRHYQGQQLAAIENQSAEYAALIEKSTAEGADKTAWLVEAQNYIDTHPKSSYAILTALVAAKEAVASKDYSLAAQHLNFVISNSAAPEVVATATLRLARVQSELQQYDVALKTLATVLPASFIAQQEELKGDVLLKSGDAVSARSAYQAAMAATASGSNPLLQVKLNELAHVAS